MSNQKLIQSRTTLKQKLKRIENYVKKFERETTDIEQIHARDEKLETIWQQYDEIQLKLEEEDEETHEGDREVFEERYYNVKSEIKRILKDDTRNYQTTNATNAEARGSRELSEAPSEYHSNVNSKINLPKMNLPQFGGDYNEWRSFYDLFRAVIHENKSISNIEKLFYLKSTLKGDALKVITSIPSTSENYEIAFRLLEERYNNNQLIINAHLKNLFSLPLVTKHSASGLRNLITDAKQQIESLKALQLPVDQWDVIVIYLLTQKIDLASRREWEMNKCKSELPKLIELFEFLEMRCTSLEAIEPTAQPMHVKSKSRSAQLAAVASNPPTLQCHLCKNNHRLYQCTKFHELDIQRRIEAVKAANVCFNCLNPGHSAKHCRGTLCKKCGKNHSTFIHLDHHAPAQAASQHVNQTPEIKVGSVTLLNSSTTKHVLLSTALIRVQTEQGKWIECRALLDSASQSNFVSEKLISKLNKPKLPYNTQITGISGTKSKITHSAKLHISSRVSNYHRELEFLILEKITCNLPNLYINVSDWNIPTNLQLADPRFNEPNEIDLLIGAEVYLKLMSYGHRSLGTDLPSMQNTVFGWITSGCITQNESSTQEMSSQYNTFLTTTDELLTRFWELESFPSTKSKTKEEIECEEHFQKTIKRDKSGRYVAQLPVREDKIKSLGKSHQLAKKRFEYMLRRFNNNQDLRKHYTAFMEEYLLLNHMEEVSPTEEMDTIQYFIPHHAVFKETSSSTKLRVVFDASMKSDSGVSLNDVLKVGPTVQPELLTIVMRFRMFNYVFTTDIQKMYRQILINEHQRHLQLIFWTDQTETEARIYKLNTVTYGTASAPFIATRCLQQLAMDEGELYPLAKTVLLENCYVDDIMAGTNSLTEARELQEQLIALLSKGGFTLHKWCANHNDLLKAIAPTKVEPEVPLAAGNGAINLLGLLWLPAEDQFKFVIHLKNHEPQSAFTKRTILSDIASIFDPLGLLAPVIVKAKIILQQLWKQNLTWDEEVPIELRNEWSEYRDQLQELETFTIDRQLTLRAQRISYEIHGFSDASQVAYGACIYLKTTNELQEVCVKLIAAKSRIAPIKPLTIPRLELCASLILARLVERVINSLKLEGALIHLWTDSTITLSWLTTEASRYKTFVANRVAEVQELTKGCKWHHVPTSENPADVLSRGANPSQLKITSLWWNGPHWLKTPEITWPTTQKVYDLHDKSEVKPEIKLSAVCIAQFELFNKYSSLNRLQRVVAYCRRFRHNAQRNTKNLIGTLAVTELNSSLECLIRLAQYETFAEEVNELKHKQQVTKGVLKNLTPFIDDKGLLRVGGRLQNSNRSYDQKHQIILPKGHKLTQLILIHEHKQLLHAGTQAVLCSIRQKYWPIQGRSTIKKLIHHCIICHRFKTKPCSQLMGNLPQYRTQLIRAFLNSGVDYGGPILIKSSSRRNAPMTKAYIALFVCLATRAIHIELVTSLSTQSFISAFKRFISRRGKCHSIHSDNATNFKGAQHEMNELYLLLKNDINKEQIIDEAACMGITWKFIPPNAPHFGGMWEAGIKAVKFHLKRAVGNLHLSFEECYTVLTQIEACVNSRPLTSLSDDHTDYSVLTPSHFLIGHPLTAMPEPDLTELPDTRLAKWQLMQKQVQHFWRKWSKDYLNTLQQRSKWLSTTPNLKPGEIVLVKEDNQPVLSWPIARIIETHPGNDGRVRVVTIKTATGTYKRPIAKLCRLPMSNPIDESF